ncbi:hypothetical protein PA598K_03086 [Paenibacillus sp. 598K]|uniref:helix-turn-helix domain-containing protein n=1 Tax=Paenibacillus sp. 598K TaxID=1117987 RepID=UPI000FF980C8|nr:helix-turn-helix domain-containing protein [Paenibacillus sp. 598K]GBF74724.1 hypothetical protein PA598K_03086 [Paenibacillus sp. 598K]
MPMRQFNLLTVHEAMELLDISRSTLDRWRKHKHLPFKKIGKEVLIDKNELEQWIHLHSTVLGEPAKPTARAADPDADESQTIAVGYQSRSAQVWTSLVMKELGWFEEELASMRGGVPAEVRWVDASNGPQLLQQLIGGHLQLASLGDYPIALSFSLSRMLPAFRPVLLAFDGKSAPGEGLSLVVRNDIRIHHASQLADFAVSAVAQSSAGGRLPALLRRLGIAQQAEVLHRELDDSMSALHQRRLGASLLGEPYISLMKHYGTGRVMFQEEIEEDYVTGVIADESWAEHHPGAVIAYLRAHLRVHHFIRSDPAKAAAIVSRIREIPSEVAARVMAAIRWDAAIYKKDMQTLERLHPEEGHPSEALFSHPGGIPCRPEFLYRAMESLKLPVPGDGPIQGEWMRHELY